MVFNGAQFHMLVNHIPVIGFIGVVLTLTLVLFVKSLDLRRFVLLATVLVGLSALPSLWTGEPAEELVEDAPGISKALIHDHEEIAEESDNPGSYDCRFRGAGVPAATASTRDDEQNHPHCASVFAADIGLYGLGCS